MRDGWRVYWHDEWRVEAGAAYLVFDSEPAAWEAAALLHAALETQDYETIRRVVRRAARSRTLPAAPGGLLPC